MVVGDEGEVEAEVVEVGLVPVEARWSDVRWRLEGEGGGDGEVVRGGELSADLAVADEAGVGDEEAVQQGPPARRRVASRGRRHQLLQPELDVEALPDDRLSPRQRRLSLLSPDDVGRVEVPEHQHLATRSLHQLSDDSAEGLGFSRTGLGRAVPAEEAQRRQSGHGAVDVEADELGRSRQRDAGDRDVGADEDSCSTSLPPVRSIAAEDLELAPSSQVAVRVALTSATSPSAPQRPPLPTPAAGPARGTCCGGSGSWSRRSGGRRWWPEKGDEEASGVVRGAWRFPAGSPRSWLACGLAGTGPGCGWWRWSWRRG